MAADHAVIDGVETKAHIRDLPKRCGFEIFPIFQSWNFIRLRESVGGLCRPIVDCQIGLVPLPNLRGLMKRASIVIHMVSPTVFLCF